MASGTPAPAPGPAGSGAPKLTVLISGASGLIGVELVRQLRDSGHEVMKLVRREPAAKDEHNWAPSAGIIDAGLLETADVVVNLSGASLGRIPWTATYRKEILSSRLAATRTLAQAMGRAAKPPKTFLSASAVGIYGDRPGERLTDDAPRGTGFLSDVVDQWETVSRMAPEKTRVVNFRTGFVVGDGGGMSPLLLLTKLGLGARIATGGQHLPWISLYDEAAAIRHLMTSGLSGTVNLTGPIPATMDRMTRHLARAMHRPYLFALPEKLLTVAMGDAARGLLLPSQKILPTRLLADGFSFRDPTVELAVDALLAGRHG